MVLGHGYGVGAPVAAVQVHHVGDAVFDERCESSVFLHIGVF